MHPCTTILARKSARVFIVFDTDAIGYTDGTAHIFTLGFC